MRKIDLNDKKAEIRYTNWVSMLIDLIKPQNLYLIGGRGVAKTTDIIAKRSIDIIYDMPRAVIAFVSDTYVNAMTNIIPGVLTGWERNGFLEGKKYHYVIDEKPPEKWGKPVTPSTDYKHTISTRPGTKFLIKSLDRPSANAGISVGHLIGDEAKYHKWQKINKVFPTLRGDRILFQNSHYFEGHTFTTDMPDPLVGEDEWIMGMQSGMNTRQIFDIFQTALIVNDIQYELYCAKEDHLPEAEINNIQIKLNRWLERILKIRRDSTFFYIVSSLANIDVLGFNYILNQYKSMDENYEEFKKAILSVKASLEKGARFYVNLSDKHFYTDGYNYDYYDQYGIRDNIKQTSAGLRYIQENRPLEAGFDSGNMLSLVIGQEQDNGAILRILKSMYTLPPDFITELGAEFVRFFAPHKRKELLLYHDRATNNYAKVKQDHATKLKESIERDRHGKPTGWRVKLMSVAQRNIEHQEEYDLMIDMMSNRNSKLPRLLIDMYECRELKSSIENAPLRKVQNKLKKDKRSEQLPAHRLPMESTNMSDAFKYFVCRPHYLNISKMKRKASFGSI